VLLRLLFVLSTHEDSDAAAATSADKETADTSATRSSRLSGGEGSEGIVEEFDIGVDTLAIGDFDDEAIASNHLVIFNNDAIPNAKQKSFTLDFSCLIRRTILIE
jgi:hypothetical protein